MSHWYCKNCHDKKHSESVTCNENCADCGTPVEFVDTERGILFSKCQGDFYELTGKKPMVCAGNVSKGTVCGSLDYVRYLENIINPPAEEK